MPQWIRVDNGLPLGSLQKDIIPVMAMWLMSLGIEMIWNRPRQPRDNAIVERCQQTLKNWAEPHRASNAEDLQRRLDQAILSYNRYFKVSRLANRTREEAYPKLSMHTGRAYQKTKARLTPVFDYLSKGSWERKVSAKGQIYIFGKRFSVGSKLKNQLVYLKIDPKKNTWQIFDEQSRLIKTHRTAITLRAIQQLKPFKERISETL